VPLRAVAGCKGSQGAHDVSHVVRAPELPEAEVDDFLLLQGHEIGKTQVCQPPFSCTAVFHGIGGVAAALFPNLEEFCAQLLCKVPSDELAGLVDCDRIDHIHRLGQVCLGRQGERLGEEGFVLLPGSESRPEGSDEAGVEHEFPICLQVRHQAENEPGRQLLACFPTAEGVLFVGHEQYQVIMAPGIGDADRGGEAAQERR